MRNSPDSTGNYAVALTNAAMGYSSIPCFPGTKVPMVKWKRYESELPHPTLLREWFLETRANIAIVTTGLVVFDCDDPDQAARVLAECGDTPHQLRTPSGGIHLGYRRRNGVSVSNRVKVKGLPIDIRTNGGLEMLPFSVTDRGPYEWLGSGLFPIHQLPIAKIGWTRERTRKRTRITLDEIGLLPEGQGRIKFPERYCMRIQSVQGQNGSRGLVRVVCILRDAGRNAAQIFDFVQRVWGPACAVPEWSEREIRHCIDRHCKG
jgi:Bifunctional DNA primase/polymerase, N-terminal